MSVNYLHFYCSFTLKSVVAFIGKRITHNPANFLCQRRDCFLFGMERNYRTKCAVGVLPYAFSHKAMRAVCVGLINADTKC